MSIIIFIKAWCQLGFPCFSRSDTALSKLFVSTIVGLYHYEFNETSASWELHKDAMCCFEHILEAAPNKTASVRPFTSRLADLPSRTSKTRGTLLEK